MLEFICPTCGTFSLEDSGCDGCVGRADEAAGPTSLAS